MNHKEIEFDKIVEDILDNARETLINKGKEYRRNNNPYHNFEVGAEIKNVSREEIIDDFMLKHYISYRDMINDIKEGKYPTNDYVREKLGDIRNYLILLEASIINRNSK